MAPRWTEEELHYLKSNYYDLSIDVLAKELNRNENAIRCKASELDLPTQQVKMPINPATACVECGKEGPEFYVDDENYRWNMCKECVYKILPWVEGRDGQS